MNQAKDAIPKADRNQRHGLVSKLVTHITGLSLFLFRYRSKEACGTVHIERAAFRVEWELRISCPLDNIDAHAMV